LPAFLFGFSFGDGLVTSEFGFVPGRAPLYRGMEVLIGFFFCCDVGVFFSFSGGVPVGFDGFHGGQGRVLVRFVSVVRRDFL